MSTTQVPEEFQRIPFGDAINADDILSTMTFFDDWEERYAYIIDLGKQLPHMPDEKKTPERIIHGCQSQVWIDYFHDQEDNRLYLEVDSDALIVRGLSGVVLSALNRRTPAEIQAFDVEAYFTELDLLGHLSPTRGNGLRSMVHRIKSLAEPYTS